MTPAERAGKAALLLFVSVGVGALLAAITAVTLFVLVTAIDRAVD